MLPSPRVISLANETTKIGIMIVIVGYKTRAVIKTRVTDPAVQKDVRLLAAVGAGMDLSGITNR
jgi:hypothetical protein